MGGGQCSPGATGIREAVVVVPAPMEPLRQVLALVLDVPSVDDRNPS